MDEIDYLKQFQSGPGYGINKALVVLITFTNREQGSARIRAAVSAEHGYKVAEQCS